MKCSVSINVASLGNGQLATTRDRSVGTLVGQRISQRLTCWRTRSSRAGVPGFTYRHQSTGTNAPPSLVTFRAEGFFRILGRMNSVRSKNCSVFIRPTGFARSPLLKSPAILVITGLFPSLRCLFPTKTPQLCEHVRHSFAPRRRRDRRRTGRRRCRGSWLRRRGRAFAVRPSRWRRR